MSLKVIVVEDNEIDAEWLCRTLEKEFPRVDLTVKIDFEAALEAILGEENRFDLIISDHNLPGITGVEGCAELRAAGIQTPIIVLTGAGSESVAVQALKSGANDYIAKDSHGGYLSILVTIIPDVLQRYEDRQVRQQAQAEIKRIAQELEIKNRELDAFAHTVAHDLHNPLGMVVAYLSLLKNEFDTSAATTDTSQLFLSKALEMAQKSSQIIDGLLSFSRMKNEKIERTHFDMGGVVQSALNRLQNKIEERQALIRLPESWPTVVGYSLWVEEVWVNYIGNAIKYGGMPPEISLGFEAGDDPETLRFFVADNGPGMTPKQQSIIFDPFVRLQRDKDSNVEGTGLGLSIVSRIVGRLDGNVGVESEPGQGSTFHFTLPLDIPERLEEEEGMPLAEVLELV